MAGIVDERPVGGVGLGAEGAEGGGEGLAAEALGKRYGEAVGFQRLADQTGVGDRIGERGDVLIGAVADDEGDTLFGMRGAGRSEERRKGEE